MSLRGSKKLLIGNWKMNPLTVEEAKLDFARIKRTASRAKRVSVAICPSTLHFLAISKLAAGSPVRLGVQDAFSQDSGAYTGRVSAAQAARAGASFSLCGHSELRAAGDTDERVAEKLSATIKNGMAGVLCVGETTRDRDGNFFSFLREQLLASLSGITAPQISRFLMLAYEPIWAVGRADMQAMKPIEVHETAIFLRKVLHDAYGAEAARAVPILYGGSVSPDNAAAIVKDGGVEGLLVGRESLDPRAFARIITELHDGHASKRA